MRCSRTNGAEVLLSCVMGGEGLGSMVGVECPFP